MKRLLLRFWIGMIIVTGFLVFWCFFVVKDEPPKRVVFPDYENLIMWEYNYETKETTDVGWVEIVDKDENGNYVYQFHLYTELLKK